MKKNQPNRIRIIEQELAEIGRREPWLQKAFDGCRIHLCKGADITVAHKQLQIGDQVFKPLARLRSSLLHEMWHLRLDHLNRFYLALSYIVRKLQQIEGRVHEDTTYALAMQLWNYAADLEVNSFIVQRPDHWHGLVAPLRGEFADLPASYTAEAYLQMGAFWSVMKKITGRQGQETGGTGRTSS
jgi:hypothetical protein